MNSEFEKFEVEQEIKKEPLDEDSIEQNEDPQKVENTTDYFSTSKGPMMKLEGLYL